MIIGRQIHAARALAGMCQEELATAADVTVQTVGRLEASGAGPVPGRAQTLQRVLDALAVQGVQIVPGGCRLIQEPASERREAAE